MFPLMRLTPRQVQKIKEVVARHFGESATVRLFGSRLDDRAKGGDFDFFVELAGLSAEQVVEGKHRALAELFHSREFFERKVDLVVCRSDSGFRLPIYELAQREGLPL